MKTRSRFFNSEAQEILEDIFRDVETKDTWQGESVLIALGKKEASKSLFRARVVDPNRIKTVLAQPEKQLGPPPSEFAGTGRMNAYGISIFYGATDKRTAIAEVRPSVGSTVLVAKFDIVRDVQILDLDILANLFVKESYFSEQFADQITHAVFLRKLGKLCSKPVLPGAEKFEYLVTQAVAEFLASNPAIDGIAYPLSLIHI